MGFWNKNSTQVTKERYDEKNILWVIANALSQPAMAFQQLLTLPYITKLAHYNKFFPKILLSLRAASLNLNESTFLMGPPGEKCPLIIPEWSPVVMFALTKTLVGMIHQLFVAGTRQVKCTGSSYYIVGK